MSFKNRWTISSSYEFHAHQQSSQRRCCFSQTALLWFEVLPDMSPALQGDVLCNVTRHLGDGKRVIVHQRLQGSVRAIRAVWNTQVFQTETRVVADGSGNWFLVRLENVCYNGKERSAGTAGTVRHARGIKYGQNGERRVFVRHNSGNAISDSESSHWCPRTDEVPCWVSWAWNNAGYNGKTPSYASSKPHGQIPSLPKWPCNESANTLEMQRIMCPSTQWTHTANSRDITTSAQSANRPNW